MQARELIFEPGTLEVVHRHAAEGYPHEVVGILAGHRSSITRVAALVNERADRAATRYLVSGLALLRAQQALEAEGLEILGYYHSHPNHTAQYSEFDRDHALPNLSYVIVSVRGGVPVDTRAWRLRDDRAVMLEQPVRTLTLESQP